MFSVGGTEAASPTESPPDRVGRPDTWIAVNTQPHRERLALANLERQGYTTYCPWMRARVCHARRSADVLRPLFPGYLFVAIDIAHERWRPILSTLGVRAVVCDGDTPSRLAPEVVAALRAREIDGAIVRPPVPYEVGQQVRLAGGAFDGVAAKIIALDDKDRVTVLLDLLRQPVKARLSSRQLRPG